MTPRHELAIKRLRNILRSHVVASARILEQKISDAGPTNQRIDPHILTTARHSLTKRGEIVTINRGGVPWFHLEEAPADHLKKR
jgi:hypothetical protein